ncbi:MAG TPA: methyltransferase domain-containing protein [Thermoanaerobaculia bacterium]|jgi:SAM-dependent methyltransferase
MSVLRRLADRRDARSWSAWFRRRRSAHLASLLARVDGPLRILDVGGEAVFWEHIPLPGHAEIVILNLDSEEQHAGRFTFVAGDARNLRYADREFDVVVSNSVIEHVDDQAAMAREIRRVGKRYYVQTPNRRFVSDPHFLVPAYHLLPRRWRVALLQRFTIGWLQRARSRREAEETVDSIRLLTAAELRALFPEATLWRERIAGMTKSLVVHYGW